jgi:hypothetical protein
MTHWLAWSSDDFMYRISVLSWGWCCICSIRYHWSGCDQRKLQADLTSQLISQIFMSQQTRANAWPIIIGAILPVGFKMRMAMNCIGALYIFWDGYLCRFMLLASYACYFAQYIFGLKWFHSIFHLLLNFALGLAALSPAPKYTLPVNPVWAWPVFWGPVILFLN